MAYGALCTEFYDLDKPAAPPEELAFWTSRLEGRPGRVLEPMCGSGRFLVPLAARGVPIDGVDASGPMLEACRRRLRAAGLRTDLVEARVEEMELPGRYATAILPAGSFGLLDHQAGAARRALRGIRRHLEPGGRLLVEFERPGAGGGATTEVRTVRAPDGAEIRLTVLTSFEEEGRVSVHRTAYVRVRDGRVLAREEEDLRVRAYAPGGERFRHPSELHGEKHVARVIVHALDLADRTGNEDQGARLWAAAYLHDLAREHDGVCRRHGRDAAARLDSLPEVVALFRSAGLDDADLADVRDAVARHPDPDDPPGDSPKAVLARLLKDADALDRVRLGDLDERYLRFPETASRIPFATRLLAASTPLPPGPSLLRALLEVP